MKEMHEFEIQLALHVQRGIEAEKVSKDSHSRQINVSLENIFIFYFFGRNIYFVVYWEREKQMPDKKRKGKVGKVVLFKPQG